MNKHVKTLVVLTTLGIVFAGIFFWQAKQTSISTSQSLIAPETTNKENDSTSTSFIESLRKRDYKQSQITIESTISNNGSYSGYIFFYLSDDLKIYGRMNVPTGTGPFPVIILNHGYFNQSSFSSGDGTQTIADILARNGYLTLASDYRGFGKSENDSQGSQGHHPNYAIDILNLIASVSSLDKADSSRIGMWGHSMGGEVSIRTAEVTDKVKAVVLWAPTSTNQSENAAFYGRGRQTTPLLNQDEGTTPTEDSLRYITAPISLHQGLADTEVDPLWSKELNSALGKENKTVEYFEYPGQDHNFRNLGWDVISKRTINFFDIYLK